MFTQQVETMRGALHLGGDWAYALFNRSVDSQAAVRGLNDIFYISAIIFIAIMALICITRSSRSAADASSATGAH